jgi:biotin carboxyl carrier protein
VEGNTFEVLVEEETGEIASVTTASAPEKKPAPAIEVLAQLPGNVYEILCAVGKRVKKGDTLVILEAMKMETLIAAPEDGKVTSLAVEKGMTVQAGQLIATLEI